MSEEFIKPLGSWCTTGVLAQYPTFNAIYELNGISEDKSNRFFHEFTK
jgi:hypothetical protein